METNGEQKTFVICGVCGGKGGWKKKVANVLDQNWMDCPICEGLGFYEPKEEFIPVDYESEIFNYNKYKKLITELLGGSIATVQEFYTDDLGKTIKIKIFPYNRTTFTQFLDYILRLGNFSTKLEVEFAQRYIYKAKQNQVFSYWELTLKTTQLSDLDGFTDVIRIWDKGGTTL